jgi:NitT/TauT family transport system ATP-binding protein
VSKKGVVEVLRDVSFDVQPGEFLCIIGSSGAGKSTLLQLIDGLLDCDAGSIEVDSRRVTGPGSDRGFVFQSDALLPWRRMVDNVRIGLQIRGVAKSEQKRIAMEMIDLVGLRGFESSYPHQLSVGMRQRVNIARAFAIDPDVLLMDEPFGSLDAQTREVMQAELLNIWMKHRKTVLFVTHQIEEAVYLADRIVVLPLAAGPIREIVTVDLPRPRPLEIKHSKEFIQNYVDRLWALLRDDIFAASSTATSAAG